MSNEKKRLGIFENIEPATPTKKTCSHDNTRNIQQCRLQQLFAGMPLHDYIMRIHMMD